MTDICEARDVVDGYPTRDCITLDRVSFWELVERWESKKTAPHCGTALDRLFGRVECGPPEEPHP